MKVQFPNAESLFVDVQVYTAGQVESLYATESGLFAAGTSQGTVELYYLGFSPEEPSFGLQGRYLISACHAVTDVYITEDGGVMTAIANGKIHHIDLSADGVAKTSGPLPSSSIYAASHTRTTHFSRSHDSFPNFESL